AAVDQCPKEWNATNWSASECENDYSGTSGKANAQNGSISDRVNKRKNEETCDDKMAETEPVRRVTKEWKLRIGVQNSRVNARNETAKFKVRIKPTIKDRQLPLQR